MKRKSSDINQNVSKSYKEPKKFNVNDPDHYFNLGNEYSKLKQYDISQKYYKQAIELDPTNPKYYCNLGITHVKLGNYEEVESCYRQLTKLNPENTKSSNYLSGYIDKEIKKVESLINDLRETDTQVIGGSSTVDKSEGDTNI